MALVSVGSVNKSTTHKHLKTQSVPKERHSELFTLFPQQQSLNYSFVILKNKIRVWEKSYSIKATFVFTFIHVGSQFEEPENKNDLEAQTHSKASGLKVHPFWHLEM